MFERVKSVYYTYVAERLSDRISSIDFIIKLARDSMEELRNEHPDNYKSLEEFTQYQSQMWRDILAKQRVQENLELVLEKLRLLNPQSS